MRSDTFEPLVRMRILDTASIRKIHEATFQVLEETGLEIPTQEGRDILLAGGCRVSRGNVVTFPAKRVEAALRTAPSVVVLYDRLGGERCVLEGWKTSYGTGSDCPFILDSETGERRPCTYEDVALGARLCDSLENFDFVMPMGIVSDRPTHTADVHAVEASMKNTVKPIVFTAHTGDTFRSSVDLAAAVAGGLEQLQKKPTVCLYAEPISPLRIMPEATDKLILAARLKIPVIFTPCPLMGATAPGTRAGILVQSNAECLGGLVLHQLVNPGAPIVFGGVLNSLDMSTTIDPYGSPELRLLCAAMTDLAHHYRLPMFGTAGCSDAKAVDDQAGSEVGTSILMATLTGQNLIHDIGYLDSALVTSFELCLFSDEAIAQAKYIASGIEVNPDTLATGVIQATARGGDYLAAEHTVEHLRREFYFPKVADRSQYDTWEREGKRTMDRVLNERVEEIIRTHRAEPIPGTALKAMDEVMRRVDREV